MIFLALGYNKSNNQFFKVFNEESALSNEFVFHCFRIIFTTKRVSYF